MIDDSEQSTDRDVNKSVHVLNWGNTLIFEHWVQVRSVVISISIVDRTLSFCLRPVYLVSVTLIKKSVRYDIKMKPISVTALGGLWGCVLSRLPYLLYNQPKDDGEVVSLTRRTHFNLKEHSWYSFMLEAESTLGPYCWGKGYVDLKETMVWTWKTDGVVSKIGMHLLMHS
jgi:hypothetical protein